MNLNEKIILNPEKLNHMFGGILSLDDIELNVILLFDGPSITFQFYAYNLPTIIPKKWEQKKFNSFRFSLKFIDIKNLNISFWAPRMKCSPIITKEDDLIHVEIHKDNEKIISCESSFLELSDIDGYYESGVP